MKLVLLIVIGVSGGVLVAGGMFALITKLDVITRMIACSKTADKIRWYERVIIIGAVFGNIVSVFHPPLYGGAFFLLIYGFMSGIFTGSLAMALAESVNAIPVFMRKLRLDIGVKWIVLAFAAGKCAGSLLWFLHK